MQVRALEKQRESASPLWRPPLECWGSHPRRFRAAGRDVGRAGTMASSGLVWGQCARGSGEHAVVPTREDSSVER
eukprot:4443703-Alexandrium_andersonii.AAC.1